MYSSKNSKTQSCLSQKNETKKYSKLEVALHNTAKDCWVIINDKVYDFSGYGKSHPGGEKVFIELAGKDATEAYEDSEHPQWITN